MKILESYENFLLDIVYQDNDYNKNEDPKILLRKFIDRFQFLMAKQNELNLQKKEAEENRDFLVKNQQEESSIIQNTIFKMNSEIRRASSSIEQLKQEDILLEKKLATLMEDFNSYIIRKPKWCSEDIFGN